MRWPWRRSQEVEAREAVRQVIDTHRKTALETIEAVVGKANGHGKQGKQQ